MKKYLLALLPLLFWWHHASAQPNLVNCALSTPCTLSGPASTGTGDPAYVAFGKGNINWLMLPALEAQNTCQLVATSNVASLSGLPFIDQINGVAGNCILLTHQTTGSQNGPLIMSTGAWTPPYWYSTGSTTQAVTGLTIQISGGSQYAGSLWYLSTPGTITIGTSGTTWNRLSAPSLAVGSTNARSGDERAADVANLLDYEPTNGGPSGIMRFFPNGSAPQCTASSGSVTLSQAFPTAWNGATIFLPFCGNPGALSWTVQSPGSGYVPQDTPILTGGTDTTAGQLVVYSTAVQSATVLNGGTTCAGTSATLTGTTGLAGTTGTAYFTAAATVSGGVVTAINSIAANGPYWQNPVTSAGVPFTGAISGTTLTVTAVSGPPYNALGVGSQITGTGVTGSTAVTGLINVNSVSGVGTYTVNNSQTVASETMLTAGEPVTGDSCVGTVLSVSMGLNSGAVYVAGNYTSTPSNPITLTGGSGSSGTVNVTWEGNPLVTTVTGGAGTGNITVSPVAQSTSTGATQTWVEAWIPSELDDTAFANMIASGKQHMVLNSLGLASGWNMCYAIGAGHSLPTLYPYDLDGQHECVIGVAQTAGGMFTMANGGFRQNIGSSIHDALLDGLGFFQRNITMTGWDQWAYGNTLRNAYGVNVGFEGASVFESHVLNTTIINDASVMLTMPSNAIEVEHQDNRVGPNVTIQGFQNCAVFTSNVGDINVTDVHAYGGIENTFCLNDEGSVDTALYPDSVAPAFAGVVIANGYLTLQGVYIHNAGSYAGQQGVLIQGPHVQVSGLTGGNGLPDGQTIVNLGGTTNTIIGNSVGPTVLGSGAFNINSVSGAGAATKYVCVDASGNVLIQSAAC